MRFGSQWSVSAIEQLLANPNQLSWGVFLKEDSKLISYLITIVVAGEADIISIATDPEYSRRGFGSQNLKHLMDSPKIHKIVLEVDVGNEAALAMYSNLGFTVDGVRKNYYNGERDAYRMSLNR